MLLFNNFFYCNFAAVVKNKNTIFDKKIARQTLGMLLLMLFSVFQFIQYHHHHHPSHKKTATEKSINISQQCELCDFVLKKQNSHLEALHLSLPAAPDLPISKEGFHYQANWSAAYALLTDNKGPPLAS